MQSPQTHLIVGGAGFIGRHAALQLLRDGQHVVVADRVAPDLGPDTGLVPFRLLELSGADWDDLLKGVDVVHLYAWSSIPASANADPHGDLSHNLGVTLALLEALRRRGGGRVLFSSSGGTVYGRTDELPTPEHRTLRPITAYGAGKAAAELYLGLYRDLHGLDCRVARIANPYGAGQDVRRGQGAVTTFLLKAQNGEEIVIWGDGSVRRDYIHIADVARALSRMATLPSVAVPVLNIGSGEGLSLNQIIAALEHRLGRPLPVRREPSRSFDVPTNVLCIDQARRVLGWAPALSFAEGLDRTIRDLSRHAPLSSLD